MVRLDLSFLNTFEAYLDGQPISQFRSANNQGLLVYLALNSDKPQPRDVLATLFWPEETEKTARHNLRQALYHWRTILGDTKGNAEPFLKVSRQTVQFNLQSEHSLDVHQFLEAIEGNDLRTAAALYQGDLLPGFTCDSLQFEEWLRQERESLHQLALEAMFELAQDYLADGRFSEAQAIARRQLKLEPWREKAFRQLMRAYALDGDRSGALATYEQSREVLWHELGVELAAETVSLYEEIEAGQLAATPTEKARHVKNNLPSDTTPFLGRLQELKEIRHLLLNTDTRLLTLVGPGGIGKTRLAIAAARSIAAENGDLFPDGVVFASLAPIDDPQAVGRVLADALGYVLGGDGTAPNKQLPLLLGDKNLMLIVDNLEHLVGGELASLLGDILAATPGVKLLATSRERLNLRAETLFVLGGMNDTGRADHQLTLDEEEASDAVRLFLQSARRSKSDFALTEDNAAAVNQICALAGGMPLAIELAAGWVALLEPQEIVVELAKSLDILSTAMHDVPERQRSLRAVFDGSWQRLSDQEQEAFLRLSVFRGGFQREEGELAAGVTLPVLLLLVSRSFLQRSSGSRFGLHEQMRFFANERLHQDEQAWEAAKEAHSQAYAAFLARQLPRLRGEEQRVAMATIDADFDNIRVAWAWLIRRGDFDTLVEQMLPALHRYAAMTMRFAEVNALLKQTLDQLMAIDRGQESVAYLILQTAVVHLHGEKDIADFPLYPGGKKLLKRLWPLATAHQRQMGDWFALFLVHYYYNVGDEAALEHWQDYIAGLRDGEDRWLLAYSLLWFGYAHATLRDWLTYGLEALALFRQCGDKFETARVLISLGWHARHSKDFERTIDYFQQAQQLLAGQVDDVRRGWLLTGLFEVYLGLGRVNKAFSYVAEQQALYRRLNRPDLLRESLHWESVLACRHSNLDHALRARYQCLELTKKLAGSAEGGTPVIDIGWNYFELAEIYRASGDLQKATGYYDMAGEIFNAQDFVTGQELNRRGLGFLALAKERFEEAEAIFRAHLPWARGLLVPWESAVTLTGLGRTLIGLGRYQASEDCLREALVDADNPAFIGLIFNPIGALAELRAAEGDYLAAGQMAAYVLGQRLTWLETRDLMENLLQKIQPHLDAEFDRLTAAAEAAQTLMPDLNLTHLPELD
jgi:predicted ATPase/DNA-binding SARP family transcriptional activator